MDLSEKVRRLADIFDAKALRNKPMSARQCQLVAIVLDSYAESIECMEVATLAPHARAGLSVVREACDG